MRALDPLLPLVAEDFGVTTGAAAAAVTAFALGYGLLQVVCGPLGDRYGRYRTIAGAAFISAFGSLACAMAPDLGLLVAARFLAGATIGAFIPLSIAWIGDSFAYSERQPILARFLIGQMLGIGFGTAMAGALGERFGWRATFVLLAVVLLAIAVLLTLQARRQPRPSAPAGLMQSFARLPRVLARRSLQPLLATAFFEGCFVFGALAFVALYLQRRFALGPGAAGALIAVYALGGLTYAAAAPRALRRFGETGLAGIGGAALAFGYGALAASPWLVPAVAGLALIGAGFYMMHTTLQANVTQVPAEERGSAFAFFATFLFLGQAAGVAVGAHVAEGLGLQAVFAASALGLAVLTVAFRRRLLSSRRAR